MTLDKLTWLSELDGPQTGGCNPELPCTGNPQSSAPPDELNFYVDVGGQWRQLQAPPAVNGQYNLTPGTDVPLADSFDLWLSGSPSWRVLARGRECDQPNMQECSAAEEGFNDDAGIGADIYQGGGGVGAHTMSATSDACTKSTAGACFTLAYRIEDLGAS